MWRSKWTCAGSVHRSSALLCSARSVVLIDADAQRKTGPQLVRDGGMENTRCEREQRTGGVGGHVLKPGRATAPASLGLSVFPLLPVASGVTNSPDDELSVGLMCSDEVAA